MRSLLIAAGLLLAEGCHLGQRSDDKAPRARHRLAAVNGGPSAPVAATRTLASGSMPAQVAVSAAPRILTPAQIAAQTIPSVVLIRTRDGLGTGFIIAEGGKIATNLHVIRDARDATVLLSDGRELRDVEVLATDEDHDLAILRTPLSGPPPLVLGDSQAVQPGARIVAIGHPLGFGNTVSDGLVSAVRVVDKTFTVFQISAPISAGSSGGPILDEQGRVIGVSSLVSARGQNLNFCMPVAYLLPLLTSEKGISLAELAARLQAHRKGPSMMRAIERQSESSGLDEPPPPRMRRREIPIYPVSVLRGCSEGTVKRARDTIKGAVELGAPLYNEGNHEACFRIFEAAALELDRDLPGCPAAKRALVESLRRATAAPSFDDKTFALRDTFDGLVDVMTRRLDPPARQPLR